jgi:steroid 5-alpha reductase family enzyme
MIISILIFFLHGSIALLAIFTFTWLLQLKTRNAAIVDAVWAVSFPILAVIYSVECDSFGFRQGALLIMILAWGMRLASHLYVRTVSHVQEDARYSALREKWGSRQNILMLRFFYFQAILALILSLPFALVISDSSNELTTVQYGAIVLWFVAVVGESAADNQLKNFKSEKTNAGKICDEGLWRYSRHPNYFFEWLVWVSYFVFAFGSPWGWVSVISPLLMLYFLLNVTGIPYTEEQMLKSRGEPFISYKKATSAFIPLPKKKKN